MKCNDMEVLDAEMSFFKLRDDCRPYVNLGKSYNLINDSITKWRVFDPTLH